MNYKNVPRANRDAYTVVEIANPYIQIVGTAYAKVRNLTREKTSDIASGVHSRVANMIATSVGRCSFAIVTRI